jgi:hypothetical protein
MTTMASVLWLALRDPANKTILCYNEDEWIALARHSVESDGPPVATLHTDHLKRILYRTGLSVDLVLKQLADAPYQPVTLQQHILRKLSRRDPIDAAREYMGEPRSWNPHWIFHQPDPAFADGDIVLVLSHTDRIEKRGHLFRRSAIHMKGPRPQPFVNWPDQIGESL